MSSKETVAVVLDSKHLATIRQFAKDNGYPSTSSALRRILDEWATLKAEKLQRERRDEMAMTDRATCAPFGQ